MNDKNCSICITPVTQNPETPEEEAYYLPCGHIYHEECILKWLEMHLTCPCCRIPVFITLPQQLQEYQKFRTMFHEDVQASLEFMSRHKIERPAKFDHLSFCERKRSEDESRLMSDRNIAQEVFDTGIQEPYEFYRDYTDIIDNEPLIFTESFEASYTFVSDNQYTNVSTTLRTNDPIPARVLSFNTSTVLENGVEMIVDILAQTENE